MSNNIHTSLFDLSSIHQRYWKDFCDVCYSRFGFEQGEVRTYEQKYETFCRCKGFVTEQKGYEQQLMEMGVDDLESIKAYADSFFSMQDGRNIVPAAYYFVRQLWSIEESINKDIQLIKYICPRRMKVDYSAYKIEFKPNYDNLKLIPTLRDVIFSEIDAMMLRDIMREDKYDNLTYDLTDNEFIDQTIKWIMDFELRAHVSMYNSTLQDFIDAHPNECECPKGSELQAFLYRLFMSYEESLREIKELVEEYPAPRNLEVLKGEYERLVEEFEETRLGEHWIECIEEKEGLQHIAKFFMHKRKRITEEEEQTFFYTLDKICIISDILEGKADKYWLEVVYPEKWIRKEEQITVEQLPESRQQIVKKLLRLVGKGDWIEPATENGVKDFVMNALGVGSITLTADDNARVTAMWRLLETGRGDRVTVVFQNLIGYYVSCGWLKKGSPALNMKFFGTKDTYSNIDKGNPRMTDMSEGFKKVLPLLDKCAEAMKP